MKLNKCNNYYKTHTILFRKKSVYLKLTSDLLGLYLFIYFNNNNNENIIKNNI